jgi:maltooligosyltrehalose trehalohydrolase
MTRSAAAVRDGGTGRAVRRLPVGAEVQPGGGVHFRVWAPRTHGVEVVVEGGDGDAVALEGEDGEYFSGLVEGAGPGTRYRFRLGGDDAGLYPDPASRFQPEGPHGPSEVVDPAAFRWSDAGWRGVPLEGEVLYEMHIGTFTREGTWEAASRELPELAAAGITVLEVMPVADFPGAFGWGYDGVDLFAPTRLYGRPDDFRRFVDRAHAQGLAVILDVVYNHCGPDGCFLPRFSDTYVTDRHPNEWGAAINYDGPGSAPVREFVVANAGYWIDEFHLDGLRLDATQTIHDASDEHVLAVIARRVRAAAGGRRTLLVAENEPQHVRLVRPVEQGGYGLDALWNDDFHHSARVAVTGRNEAYYTDYLGTPQELVSAVKWGYLYQGQRYVWQRKRRGTPTFGVPPAVFVTYTQNHDQVANAGRGERLHRLTSPGRYRAITALHLLAPGTPLLFQGQEFCASTPWVFFADHRPDLGRQVRRGRLEFLGQFPSLASPAMEACLLDPGDRATFERCRLDLAERQTHAEAYALHRDLLRLRRQDPVFAAQRPGGVDGAVLGPEALVLRYFGGEHGDRLLIVNLGRDLELVPAPEPLLAPPGDGEWRLRWSSEDPRYGGCGTPLLDPEGAWRVPGQVALMLSSRASGEARD